MALAATTIWEVQAAGSGSADDGSTSGAFNPNNANMATDLTTDTNTANTTAPVVSSASYNFVSRDVGAWLFIKSGTNWTPGWYKISSVASNKATLDGAIGHGVLCTQNVPAGLTTAAGCATVGTPTSGTWTIDYSQKASVGVAFTDMATASTTTFTSAANPIGVNFVGNVLSITSGTGWNVCRCEISSVSGVTATCANFSTGSTIATHPSTGGTGGLGGPLSTPGYAASVRGVNAMPVFIGPGTYTLTTATANTAGGTISDSASGATNQPTWWEGYETYRTDRGTQPILAFGSITSATMYTVTGGNNCYKIVNLQFGKSTDTGTSNTGATAGRPIYFVRCVADTCKTVGFTTSSNATYIACRVTGSTGTAAFYNNGGSAFYVDCVAHANTIHGFLTTNVSAFVRCIAYSNSGGSTDGFKASSANMMSYVNCVAYSNGQHGFNIAASTQAVVLENCIAESNTGTGFYVTSATTHNAVYVCAAYNNGTNFSTNWADLRGSITQSAGSFFTNAGSGDFSLNNTSGRGALLRGAGTPGLFPASLTTGYIDIGAAQHQDAGGAAGIMVHPGMTGGMRG